jgi:hypothetical protein
VDIYLERYTIRVNVAEKFRVSAMCGVAGSVVVVVSAVAEPNVSLWRLKNV